MNCDEADILLHALLDGELDAGHAREVETHIAGCTRCAARLEVYRDMSKTLAGGAMRLAAPPRLRQRVTASLPVARKSDRRAVLKGFAMGSAVSAIAASGFAVIVLRNTDEQRILSDVVSAHLRSLQPGHLTDVLSSDQHTVKPWFNGRLDVAPPVIDLIAQGFTLIGGRLDSIDGHSVGAIVYRRRTHVINLFVIAAGNTEPSMPKIETLQGFSIRQWRERGLQFWAISDLGSDEFSDFGSKFDAALRAG